jgi:hypothetical protein
MKDLSLGCGLSHKRHWIDLQPLPKGVTYNAGFSEIFSNSCFDFAQLAWSIRAELFYDLYPEF